MTIIQAKSENDLTLGRQGENLARQVVFDLSAWEAEYGPGVAELIHQRPGDALPYPVAAVREGSTLVWTLTATDTAVASSYGSDGHCELRYYVGEVLVKSRTWLTKIIRAMSTPSETAPPEPEQGWVDQVVAVGAAAQASADAAKADADRAAALAAEVAEKAAQAAQDASDAAKAREAAQTAQRLAEEAQGAAETARTAAEVAQAAAETAATDAAGAKLGAETAQKAAQDAAAAAANILKSIQTLYQEMQTWAQGVIQDVNAAGSAAVQSVQSAGDAQVQRVTDEGTTQTANAKAQADAAAQSASEAAQSAQEAAESAAVYDDVVTDVTQLKQDVAAITPDDAAVDDKPWTSKKIVDIICQPFEESGNPVQCYPVENYPLGVKASWEPVQEGSGDPSPDNIRPITGRDVVSVTRCGKNLLCPESKMQNLHGIKWTESEDGSLRIEGSLATGVKATSFMLNKETKDNIYAAIKSGINLSVSGLPTGVSIAVYDANWVGTGGATLKFPSGMGYPDNTYFEVRRSSYTFNGTYYPQIELGSTATPYEPYISSTTDIALPETVYGGTLDVETGVVNTTWGYIASYAGEALPGEWISDRDVYSSGAVPTTGAQVAYKLAEPRTIQLTPQKITALSGVNTIYTDADGVVVTGAEDPKHTITELKNAIISLGGNV